MPIQNVPLAICSLPRKSRKGYVVVLDAGTTGIKAFVFDGACRMLSKAERPLGKRRPTRGWVEQDPLEIVRSARAVLRKAVRQAKIDPTLLRGVGITNQRESTIVWEERTGRPVYPVIGWEDTRTRAYCATLRARVGKRVRALTGLTLDSYFSASKIRWILRHVTQRPLRFGTIDTWLVANLCEGRPHVTDETNASRTLLFDITKRTWSKELLALFGIPSEMLPHILPSRSRFGRLALDVLGVCVPVMAVCGDQQASTYAALRVESTEKGATTKVTYGTGVFVVQVIGKRFVIQPDFFTTLVPAFGKGSLYAIEAKIEKSGETVSTLLSSPVALTRYFRRLATHVNRLIQSLPVRPSQIVVDGGVARSGLVASIQQEVSRTPVCLQSPFDGTALGCALLVWDSLMD